MTRKINEMNVALMAAVIMMSMQASALAANITVVQDTDINVEQYSEPQKAETTFTETESTTITSEFTTEYITKEYTTEETTETTTEETTEEITEETTETTEATTEEITEETTEATTEAVTFAPGIDIDVLNSNYFQIQDNYGNIYIYVYTGTDVKLYTQDGKEADVDILTGNDIQIVGDGGPLASTEATTETTTVCSKSGHSGSSGGHRRIKSVSTTTEATTETTTKDMQAHVSQDKKTVRMQIGNNSMYVDGSIYETNSSPYISQGYTLVPLRCISAVFDAQVGWDNDTKTAYINTDSAQTCFTIDSDRMVVNGCYEKIPKSAELCAGRTYVPIRALGEALGADVSWIQDTKTVLVAK